MGHSEMLLAVAGLSETELKKRTKNLAEGNWNVFPPAERLAFGFAHKQARDPAAIETKEVKQLLKTFGPHRTIDLIWYGAWCNYMTRVADAFQLPLEKQNVFARREPPQRKPVRAPRPKRNRASSKR